MSERASWAIRPEFTIRLDCPVRADWPFRGHAASGTYGPDELQMNPHGALSVDTPTGWLGLRPHEVEVVDMCGHTCSICSEPAACFGAYEGGEMAYSCSVHCGHGNEDGWCWHIGHPDEVSDV